MVTTAKPLPGDEAGRIAAALRKFAIARGVSAERMELPWELIEAEARAATDPVVEVALGAHVTAARVHGLWLRPQYRQALLGGGEVGKALSTAPNDGDGPSLDAGALGARAPRERREALAARWDDGPLQEASAHLRHAMAELDDAARVLHEYAAEQRAMQARLFTEPDVSALGALVRRTRRLAQLTRQVDWDVWQVLGAPAGVPLSLRDWQDFVHSTAARLYELGLPLREIAGLLAPGLKPTTARKRLASAINRHRQGAGERSTASADRR